MTDHVVTAVDGPILTLTLNRPDKKNALTNAMYGALADGLQRAPRRPVHSLRAAAQFKRLLHRGERSG